MKCGGFVLAAAVIASSAQADVRMREETAAVSMPYTRWELRFPGAGWTLQQQSRAPDGTRFYYKFVDPRNGLIVSFFLEPAYKCESGDACRKQFWANPGPSYVKPANERFFESGPFSVVEFTTEAGPIVHRHWSAHAVHDGVWIDMHASSMLLKDFAAFAAFGSQFVIAEKALCPECISTKGLTRQDSSILFGKIRSGDAAALQRLRQLADGGDAEAQFFMSRVCSWGAPTVQQDERQSVAWVRKAAEQGHAEAESNLAYFYISGKGVDTKQPELAMQWWTKAADRGYAPAQYNLANFYAMDGQHKDEMKFFQLSRKAAAQGLAGAQVNLGRAYARGRGTQINFDEAREWYLKAARQGDENAIVSLASLYTILGATGDKKFYGLAVAMLDDPLLIGNQRAQDLKASICKGRPEFCAGPAKAAPTTP